MLGELKPIPINPKPLQLLVHLGLGFLSSRLTGSPLKLSNLRNARLILLAQLNTERCKSTPRFIHDNSPSFLARKALLGNSKLRFLNCTRLTMLNTQAGNQDLKVRSLTDMGGSITLNTPNCGFLSSHLIDSLSQPHFFKLYQLFSSRPQALSFLSDLGGGAPLSCAYSGSLLCLCAPMLSLRLAQVFTKTSHYGVMLGMLLMPS